MLEEMVCSVSNLYAINELIVLAPSESDNHEFVVGSLKVVENCKVGHFDFLPGDAYASSLSFTTRIPSFFPSSL